MFAVHRSQGVGRRIARQLNPGSRLAKAENTISNGCLPAGSLSIGGEKQLSHRGGQKDCNYDYHLINNTALRSHNLNSLGSPTRPRFFSSPPLGIDERRQLYTAILHERKKFFSKEESNEPRVTVEKNMPGCLQKLTSVVPVSGKGCYVYGYDVRDPEKEVRKYLDFQSGIGALSTGHLHEKVISNVKNQLDTFVHAQQNCLYSHSAQDALIPKLKDVMPKPLTEMLRQARAAEVEQTASIQLNKVDGVHELNNDRGYTSSNDRGYTSSDEERMKQGFIECGARLLPTQFMQARCETQQLVQGAGFSSLSGAHKVSDGGMSPAVRASIESGFLSCAESEYPRFPEKTNIEKYASKGPLDRFFWCNSGSEATDNAMKIARACTGKSGIVAVNHGYHGRTFGAMSISSTKRTYRQNVDPLLSSCHICPEDSPDAFENLLYSQLDFEHDTAAVVVEVIQGEAGVVPLRVDFLEYLRKECTKNNVLLIFDEVQTGAGRSGEFWATEHLPPHIRPDMMTFAKGIASGFQLAGVASSEAVFKPLPAGIIGGTYGGNCVSVAAASATIDVLRDEKLVENSRMMGRKITEGVLSLIERWRSDHITSPILRMRQFGLFIAMDLDPKLLSASDVIKCAAEHDLLVLAAGQNAMRILPPLVVGEKEVEEFLVKFDTTLRGML